MLNYQESSGRSLFRLLFKKIDLCAAKIVGIRKKAGEYVGTHTKSRSLIPGYKWVES